MIHKVQKTFCLAAAAYALLVTSFAQAQSMPTRHVREEVRTGKVLPVGMLPANQIMNLDLVLPLRDPAGLKRFLGALHNPASPSYRHFLNPQEFTQRFGPTQQDFDTIVQFARDHGFEIVGGSRDGMEVQIRGPVWAVETAFHVAMRIYQHPTENRTFYAPDQEPTADLPFALWHVTGMDNYSIPRPLFVKKSEYAAAHNVSEEAVVSHASTGSGPSASFLGSDMRAAYYGGTALTGAGQNIGLLEYLGTDLADLKTYYANVGQTNNVPITLLSTDGTSTSCPYPICDDTEQTLDMTQALGMAPGLASLVMYIGSNDTPIIAAMTTHNPLPTAIGCSWGWTPADPSTLDPYFQKMAAQGQNFFAASGDSSTWSSGNPPWPADDANVVSVGGTDLVTASARGPWQSETAWVDGGGGISTDGIPIPSWQRLSGVINSGNHGSTTLRNGPDVSANANFTFYVCADQGGCTANLYGGTSFAAPMWAGFIALVNQQLAANGKPTIGFLNPTIYAQNVTSSYAADFHDIISGTSGSYSAVPGYDLVTGWGSPNAGLISALVGGGSNPNFSLSALPASVSIAQNSSGSSTITSTVTGGFNSAITLTASGQPSGVTISFSPSSIMGTGSSTMNITVASTAAAGTYPITVTGTSGTTSHTTTVTLTVTGNGGGFSLRASPSSIAVSRGTSGTVTVTSTVTGGFKSAIALSASGQGSRVTISFNPTSISAAGTSTMTIRVSSRATRGTRTITVKGTSGTTSHTTTVSLAIQ
jgi:kumamolisin